MSILEKLRERRESKKLTATENWKALVCKVATDPKIDINLVDQQLDEFGKSEADLKNAVELFLKLQEAEAVIEAGEGIREKIRENSRAHSKLTETFLAEKNARQKVYFEEEVRLRSAGGQLSHQSRLIDEAMAFIAKHS